jgi:hypothetical protein
VIERQSKFYCKNHVCTLLHPVVKYRKPGLANHRGIKPLFKKLLIAIFQEIETRLKENMEKAQNIVETHDMELVGL